ncbi:iron ABC transporter permease [candidate division WOR-3 bacterium]|nr:iron ABC transporter permease [candidate division WOR-3 bacterium]
MRRRPALAWIVLGAVLLVACAAALATGPGGPAWRAGAPVLGLRLTRLLLGIVAGGVLGLVGASLQGLLRNPLVDPYTLGVSSGAAFGTTVVLAAGLGTSLLMPVAGFAGALGTMLLVWLLARVRGRVTVTGLVLAGIITSFLFSALVMLLVVASRRPLAQAVYLLMGRLNVAFTRDSLALFAGSGVLLVAGAAVLLASARELDIMSTSEETARSLGVETGRVTRTVFVASSLLVGLVVSFTGAISFVGLVVPHLCRMLLGPGLRRNLPASFVLGAGLLVLADVLSRALVPGGLPLSIVTALVGVPFFIWLLRNRL